jgi:hypothetical protein
VALASTVILASESHGTHHILLTDVSWSLQTTKIMAILPTVLNGANIAATTEVRAFFILVILVNVKGKAVPVLN